MWSVGNALRAQKIRTYCGLMVRTDNWQEKWCVARPHSPCSNYRLASSTMALINWQAKWCVTPRSPCSKCRQIVTASNKQCL